MLVAVLAALTLAAALAWAWLLAGHGGFWLTGQRLPEPGPEPEPDAWPAVTAVIPARDEAAVLPGSLPTLLAQDYPGTFGVVLVDDESTDGTGQAAAALGREAGWTVLRGRAAVPPASTEAGGDRVLRVVSGSPPPAGWAGKVHAMSQGAAVAGTVSSDSGGYLLFTDADIGYAPGVVTALVRSAGGRGMVSQMALLRAASRWERVVVPAFVYFFAQLYPFRRVNRPGGRTAAAAGGCMLVRREALAAAGGLAAIRGARIDDVALGRALKRGAGTPVWLGLSAGGVRSTRPYDGLGELWDMVARSAYTQLRYSPVLLAGTVAGLLWLYLLPPVAAITGLATGAAGTGPAWWLAGAGAAGWLAMAVSFVPMLRLYGLPAWRGLTLPLIAVLYAGMTADSARRHHAGRGGEWKGRTIQPGTAQAGAAQASTAQAGAGRPGTAPGPGAG